MATEAKNRQKAEADAIVSLEVRLPAELVDRVDAWRATQADRPEREKAVVKLLIAHFWPNL